MENETNELTIGQVAKIVKCHPVTVRRWEERGLISSKRNHINHRIFTRAEALKLKNYLAQRQGETPKKLMSRTDAL